jgi:hypothetical protein
LTAGSYHTSIASCDKDDKSCPGKKARTSEEMRTLFQHIEQLEALSPAPPGGDNLQMMHHQTNKEGQIYTGPQRD